MTRKPSSRKSASKPAPAPRLRPGRLIRRWALRGVIGFGALILFFVLLFAVVNPPTTFTMLAEGRRLGGVEQEWADWDEIAPVMARSIVAAEDANYCLHWGFDMRAIRAAMEAGGNRGASTLSQQVVKNVFLWQGRSWPRKALEAIITPVVETVWTKRRILEVYMNVAEFDEGVFGIRAAAAHAFQIEPSELTPRQAARLAAVLPDPKGRDAANPGDFTRRRAASIIDGADTIRADGRAACFE